MIAAPFDCEEAACAQAVAEGRAEPDDWHPDTRARSLICAASLVTPPGGGSSSDRTFAFIRMQASGSVMFSQYPRSSKAARRRPCSRNPTMPSVNSSSPRGDGFRSRTRSKMSAGQTKMPALL